jgi:hypothetical protein
MEACARSFAEARRTGLRQGANASAKRFSDALRDLLPAEKSDVLKLKEATGMGSFADVPWVAVLHERFGGGATRGYYVVYLFSKDSQRVYLTLEAAAGFAVSGRWRSADRERTEANAQLLRGQCRRLGEQGFHLSNDIDLAEGPNGRRALSYIAGVAAYKVYEIGNLPDSVVMETDFRHAVHCFLEIVESDFDLEDAGIEIESLDDEDEDAGRVESAVRKKTPLMITKFPSNRLVCSLLAKPFLILTGPSGTGKTRGAVRLAGQLCGEGAWAVVAVGADWTDNRHVVGHLNLLEEVGGMPVYEGTEVLRLLLRANANPGEVHVLILDEMNLSHVERYFADFLSAMELEDKTGALKLHGAGKARTRAGEDVPGRIDYPENLLVIGTVNIDETTYMFSPKVLDRANVVEMQVEGEGMERFLAGAGDDGGEGDAEERGIGFLELAWVIREGDDDSVVPDLPDGVRAEAGKCLMSLFRILGRGRGEFGYRTAREILAYLRSAYFLTAEGGRAAWASAGGGWVAAMDEQILQKILPKVHGSRTRLSPLLGALAHYCATGQEDEAMRYFPGDGGVAAMGLRDVPGGGDAKFRRSHAKLTRMIEVLVAEQFVSFIC